MRRLAAAGGLLGGGAAVCLLAVAAFTAAVAGAAPSTDATTPTACDVKARQVDTTPIHVTTGPVQQLTAEQARVARAIVARGIADRVPRDGLIIGIMTSMQESSLTEIDHGDLAGPDSIGPFQQRAPWGPRSMRIAASSSAHLFFTGGMGGQRGLLDIPGWQSMPKTLAAQAVQVSAFPYAYAKWETLATSTVNAILGGTQPAPVPVAAPPPAPSTDCTVPKPGPVKTACAAPADVSAYGNGRIPLGKLCQVPWVKGQYLRSDALAGLETLDAAYKAAFGRDICVTEGYRTYAEQVYLYATKPPGMAAKPGTSNHGWARAADLCGGIDADGTPQHVWMLTHAPADGWVSPPWARPGASGPHEPWHWEYGTSGSGE